MEGHCRPPHHLSGHARMSRRLLPRPHCSCLLASSTASAELLLGREIERAGDPLFSLATLAKAGRNTSDAATAAAAWKAKYGNQTSICHQVPNLAGSSSPCRSRRSMISFVVHCALKFIRHDEGGGAAPLLLLGMMMNIV
jgi:hypothetical protein